MKTKEKILMVLSLILIVGIGYTFQMGKRVNNVDYSGDAIIFYPQHQDDEVLWASSAIKHALNTKGEDNVYVVLNSTGLGVGVFKEDKYSELSPLEKKSIRDDEFKFALKELGVKDDNMVIISDIVGIEGDCFDYMREFALEKEKEYDSVTHIAHSYKYDNHSLHIKNGSVIKNLYDEKLIKNAMFFVKPQFVSQIDNVLQYKTYDKDDLIDIEKACNEYKAKKDSDLYGVGYKSAPNYFKALLSDKEKTSYLHGTDL